MADYITSPLLDRMLVSWLHLMFRMTIQQINCSVLLERGLIDRDDVAERCDTTPEYVQSVLDLLVERGRLAVTDDGRYEALREPWVGVWVG